MIRARGYNPLRWDCTSHGCFNKKKRPKIELFADCFPGAINFSDVDGIVEMGGRGLLLEWKPSPNISGGQEIMYRKLTETKILSVICVSGNAETMLVDHIARFEDGNWYKWKPATLLDVQIAALKWARNNCKPYDTWTNTEVLQDMDSKIKSTDCVIPTIHNHP